MLMVSTRGPGSPKRRAHEADNSLGGGGGGDGDDRSRGDGDDEEEPEEMRNLDEVRPAEPRNPPPGSSPVLDPPPPRRARFRDEIPRENPSILAAPLPDAFDATRPNPRP